MTRKKLPSAWHLDVTFVFENDDFFLVPVSKGGVADCTLWADIAPSEFGDGDYVFVGAYLENNFTDEMVKLEGRREKEAIELLKADDGWCRWADEEAREMMGEAT